MIHAIPLLLLLGGCAPVLDYLRARGLDLADCVKANVGIGIGLTADVHLTDWVSPGIGFVSYTVNTGWEDRDLNGWWIESDVVLTPRIAWEALVEEYQQSPAADRSEEDFLARLTLTSFGLPNERWTRQGDMLRVERFALLNVGNLADDWRARQLTGLLRHPGEEPQRLPRTAWQRGSCEVGATLGLVQARAGVNPFEFVDFLLGILFLDPAGDDTVRLRGSQVR